MKQKARIVIIGLGSAGLSALGEVKKITDDFLLIQQGPYGTSCARSACMPTKTLIEVADAFHRRKIMAARGVSGTEGLWMDPAAALGYVRKLRDAFVGGMVDSTDRYKEKIIHENAFFLEPTIIKAGDITVEAERVIIATGSRPFYPESWKEFDDLLLSTEDMVEQRDLPRRMAVIGLGPAGIEYAQALSRLGLHIAAFDASSTLAGISDPEVNKATIDILKEEFPIVLDEKVEIMRKGEGLVVQAGEQKTTVPKALVAIGRKPNIEGLGLEKIGVATNERGLPDFSRQTMQIEDLPIFIAGDVNDDAAILHEAIDEGHIAGFNAARDKKHCFKRRVPLAITFTDPNIAAVGRTYRELKGEDFVIGRYDFSKQSRARMSGVNKGLLRIYAGEKDGVVLGAEMAAPSGEHLAHLLAMAIDRKMTVFDMLTLPFYHPTIEEGLRTAIRDAGKKLSCSPEETVLLLCRSTPDDFLC
ncbi:MAG: dihydrolipoyl dehydrogenase [Desulfobulbaceae bacterium]|nr:dihydrolipoyl dehydrogenase [Desulfobulbaceae bacterium]